MARHPVLDDQAAVMSGPMLWMSGLMLALANFMAVLDMTIANVSVPNIAGGLAVSPSQGAWVITSYQVAEAITVPLSGWLAQRFGAVRLMVFGMIGFGVCSALCGLAPSLGTLVLFRVLQGVCGGPMMPMSQTLLRRIFPPHQQPMAIALWSMTTVVGPIIGPLFGGFLVDQAGWSWIFFINIPIAIICSTGTARLLATRETETRRVPVDGVGLGLLVLWVGCMQIVLDKGKDLDWFDSPFILGLSLTGLVGFIAFIIWELTEVHPIVDLRIFRHRGFTAATVLMSLAYAAFFSSVVLVPLWQQTNLGYTAGWSGKSMALQGVLAVVMSPIVARLATRFDLRALVCYGVSVMAVISLWRTSFVSDITFFSVSLPNFFQGSAMPFFFIPTTALAMSSVLPKETASAAGLINFSRTTAGAFGTSITLTAWENATKVQRSGMAGALNQPHAVLGVMQKAGMRSDQALGQLSLLVDGQATMAATDHMFLVIAFVFVCGALAVWISPKPVGGLAGPGAGGH